jgi:hypothetical protein
MRTRRAGVRRHWAALGVALLLCGFWLSRLSGAPVFGDAYDTWRMAVNFAHRGVMSMDVAPPYAPSMYREPLPVLTGAAMITIVDAVAGRADLTAYRSGERVRWIKAQNVLWLLLLCSVTYLAIMTFTGSPYLAIGGSLLAQAIFFQTPTRAWGVDSLYTELPATAVLMLGSWLLARGFSRPGGARMGLVGATFGTLALIKAATLYVFGGVVVVGAVLWTVRHDHVTPARVVAGVTMLVLGFGAVVTPWLLRNYETFGRFGLRDGGGIVLYMRATMSEGMWPAQFLGAFYVWTPAALRSPMGRVTGYGPPDLRRGGRLEQLSTYEDSGFVEQDRAAMVAGRPQDAVSYFYRGIAELTRLERQFAAAGVPHPGLVADDVLMRRALAYIRAHPLESLVMTVPFLWRSAMLTFPILVAALGWALWRRDDRLLMFCMPAFGYVMFYALLSHAEHRYGLAPLPVAIVAAIALGRTWWAQGKPGSG